ncbi:hypothetical protein G6O67_001848 [Ophiocordyceps sinensis]|uniref:Uncharacterized protein n=1 Tax=Ophiocordyceps sinensis TaxID=72228 RepID=A0A8H4V6L4_9HYPO|nr:hypothetical protein G6O67_001848 [Ophiocordyceps sinensis]
MEKTPFTFGPRMLKIRESDLLKHRTPVVDGKYCDDRATGEIRVAADGSGGYGGPPSVDVIVQNAYGGMFRASRLVSMEALLCHAMKVVGERKIRLDSVMATTYTLRVNPSEDFEDDDAFMDVVFAMVYDAE